MINVRTLRAFNYITQAAMLAAVVDVSRLHTEDTSIWQTDQRIESVNKSS